MVNILHLPAFINKFITKRDLSLFAHDIRNYHENLVLGIENKSVLVIGGAGTIGSAFIKCILKYKPSKLVVVDVNENSLTELTRDLRSTLEQYVPENYKTYPMSYHDSVFRKMFVKNNGFDIIANFAAHKHVRSEKDKFSIEAMLENNVFKAKEFLDLLIQYNPEKFFCVSTDKAANPVNVMGASKKLMEDVILSYSNLFNITTARFANVAFSNGSLLDGYIERLNKNQPLSCPSDVRRYFVSPEESGQICLLACILGKSGQIFFPKLEESNLISFKEITLHFLREMNINPILCLSELEAKAFSLKQNLNKEYPVFFFNSETSGEKQIEEFYTSDDLVDLNSYNGLGIITNTSILSIKEIENIINKIKQLFESESYHKNDIVKLISESISKFSHLETGKNLDQKM